MQAPEERITFKAILRAPLFDRAPAEEVEKWAKNMIAASEKTYKQSKKAIKTKKDYQEKIARPAEEVIDKFILKGKHKTHEQIMDKLRDSQKRAAKRFFEQREQAFKTPRFAERVELGKQRYARTWVKYHGPLRGYKKGGVKGLGALAVMVLSADNELNKFLKQGLDKIIEGVPLCIASPAKTGKFRNALRNQISRSGREIIELNYEDTVIQEQNEKVNQLAEEYRSPRIAPFSPDGASHIDFIAVEIPNPEKPGEMIKQLGLDIQVSTV